MIIMKNMNVFIGKLWLVFKRDCAIHGIIAVLFFIVTVIAQSYELSNNVNFLIYFKSFRIMGMVCLACLMVYYFFYLVVQRHPHPLSAYWQKLKVILAHPEEIIGFLLLMTALSVVFSSYTSLKTMIPVIQPYQYDTIFMQIDQSLHLGFEPWQVTHWLFSHPIATAIINVLYNVWFFLFWILLVFFMLRLNAGQQRQQFLISVVLCWMLIGGLLATMLSSAGPCFFSDISNGSNHYLPLMQHLKEQQVWLDNNVPRLSIWALDTQQLLWSHYSESKTALGSGISAMPSMHVSIAVLMALAMNKVNRKLGVIFWVYALFIQIGSVHLAWHYAIDGYVSFIVTVIIWKSVGYFYCSKMQTQSVERDVI